MMCTCKNCKHCLTHPEGKMCENKMVFVEDDHACLDWENDELFDPTKYVAVAIVIVAIVIFLAKIL